MCDSAKVDKLSDSHISSLESGENTLQGWGPLLPDLSWKPLAESVPRKCSINSMTIIKKALWKVPGPCSQWFWGVTGRDCGVQGCGACRAKGRGAAP